MDHAQQRVADILAHSASPAVLSSFGKDSMLLLWLVRQIRPATPVLWLQDGQPEYFARQVIREWDLTVFRWHPAEVYKLTNAEQTTLALEFGFGDQRLPLLIDTRPGPTCAVEKFAIRTPTLYLPFDSLLVGWKDCDTHWVKGDGKLAEDGFELGRSCLYAPIRHMTDAQVKAAIADHNIPYVPVDDELALCTSCVDRRPVEAFRSRFNLTAKEYAEEVHVHG